MHFTVKISEKSWLSYQRSAILTEAIDTLLPLDNNESDSFEISGSSDEKSLVVHMMNKSQKRKEELNMNYSTTVLLFWPNRNRLKSS